MTITAAEVVRHAAPIAALLGFKSLKANTALNTVQVIWDGDNQPDYYVAIDLAPLILGLIVARSGYIEVDSYGIATLKADPDNDRVGRDDFDPADDRLSAHFKAFCHAFARAHSLKPYESLQ